MTFRLILIFVAQLFCSVTMGQTVSEFEKLKKMFVTQSLPISITYSFEEQVFFGAVYHNDTTYEKEGDSTILVIEEVYDTNSYQKDSTLLIDRNLAQKYLLDKNEPVYYIEDWANNDTAYSSYYAVCKFDVSNKYYGLIYERLFMAQYYPASEKFICVFNKKGKLVSKCRIASFIYGGSGIGDSGGRVPWFPYEESVIDKNFKITIHNSYGDPDKSYKIEQNGEIVPEK